VAAKNLRNLRKIMRVLSGEVKEHEGEAVHIEGWLHKKRLLGGLTFINVRDRSGLVQVVIDDKQEVYKSVQC
jgi:nondiscriminating aspartyl-tRNA synthetase